MTNIGSNIADSAAYGIESFKEGIGAELRKHLDTFIEKKFIDDTVVHANANIATQAAVQEPSLPYGSHLEALADYEACEPGTLSFDDQVFSIGAAPSISEPHDLKSWLDEVDEPFSTTLFKLIDERGLDDVEVYKRAHMSRQLFSRIRSDTAYRPAKKTVLALAVALNLGVYETKDLLERAGFALSRSSKRDVIVEYFITNGPRDLFVINQALYEYDQPLL